MKKTKSTKNYTYNGFGFPIILENATLKMVGGTWLLKIDVLKISKTVFNALPHKPTGLTGAEIRFARTHLGLSRRKLAKCLNVSHTSVNKWERTEQEKAHIDALVEVALRSFMKLQANEDDDFSNFYREIMNEAKNFANDSEVTPLKIAT
jgi:transcriptional regulator with XRE-family HTH domain